MPNRSSDKAAAVIRENNLDHGGDIAIGVKAAMKRLGLHDLEKQIEFDFEMIRALIKKGWSVQSVVERCYLPFGKFVLSSLSLKMLSLTLGSRHPLGPRNLVHRAFSEPENTFCPRELCKVFIPAGTWPLAFRFTR